MTAIKHFFTRNRYLSPWTKRGLAVLNLILRHNPLQWYRFRVRTLNYLNVGCGKKMVPHTINLNYEWYPGVDLTYDIRWRLRLPDHRLHGIYSEHVLEHLPFASIPAILSEWRRVMRAGGLVRILVPDAELYLRIYCEVHSGHDLEFPMHDSSQTAMMHVNRAFRDYSHLYAYDFETMARMLERAGFVDIRNCEHRQGRDPQLLLDSDEREAESLRVEAVSP